MDRPIGFMLQLPSTCRIGTGLATEPYGHRMMKIKLSVSAGNGTLLIPFVATHLSNYRIVFTINV